MQANRATVLAFVRAAVALLVLGGAIVVLATIGRRIEVPAASPSSSAIVALAAARGDPAPGTDRGARDASTGNENHHRGSIIITWPIEAHVPDEELAPDFS